MNTLDAELSQRLDALREQQLYRQLRRVDSAQSPHIRIDGRELLNFSSNDYLGLANDPVLIGAATEALQRFGAGSGASRLICGSLAPHHELEETLAAFKGTEATLAFSSGYAAALGTITTLLGKDDIVVLDKLVHACIVDASRLSGAKLRVFAHNDANELEDILRWADQRRGTASPKPQVLIVTESVFSMDGDQAPLQEIVRLKDQYGAWLMVDDAHATGLYGPNRRGLAEALGLADRIEIQMGTLGKAFGASGGYICGSRPLIDYLLNRARSFVFSTAPLPSTAAAAAAGIRFVQSNDGQARCAALWDRVNQLHAGLAPLPAQTPHGPILPLMIGDEARAMEAAARLRDLAIFIPAIRFPTVPRGTARLRLTLTATHTGEEVRTLLTALQDSPYHAQTR